MDLVDLFGLFLHHFTFFVVFLCGVSFSRHVTQCVRQERNGKGVRLSPVIRLGLSVFCFHRSARVHVVTVTIKHTFHYLTTVVHDVLL